MLKRELRLPAETDMEALASYFGNYGDVASASEAYYIQGAYLNWLGKNTEAMQYLKKAENNPAPSIIQGMTYYKMGRISESEQLYDIALEYYQKALPYLEDSIFVNFSKWNLVQIEVASFVEISKVLPWMMLSAVSEGTSKTCLNCFF